MGPGFEQRFLDEIIGKLRIAAQRMCEGSKIWDGLDQGIPEAFGFRHFGGSFASSLRMSSRRSSGWLLGDDLVHGAHALADELGREAGELWKRSFSGFELRLALRFRKFAVCPFAILGCVEAVLHD